MSSSRVFCNTGRDVLTKLVCDRARSCDYGAGKRAILSPRTDPTQISLPT